jgi:hypothetical protein
VDAIFLMSSIIAAICPFRPSTSFVNRSCSSVGGWGVVVTGAAGWLAGLAAGDAAVVETAGAAGAAGMAAEGAVAAMLTFSSCCVIESIL